MGPAGRKNRSARVGSNWFRYRRGAGMSRQDFDQASARLYLNSGRRCDALAASLGLQLQLLAEPAARDAADGSRSTAAKPQSNPGAGVGRSYIARIRLARHIGKTRAVERRKALPRRADAAL